MSKVTEMPSKKKAGKNPATRAMRAARAPQLTEMEMIFCRAVQAGKKPADACVAAGWPPSKATAILRRKRIVDFLAQFQQEFVKNMAAEEAKVVIAKCPTKTELVNRLWELANMEPLGIAESIAGQVSAAKEIGSLMGYVAKAAGAEDELTGKSEDELNRLALYGMDEEGAITDGTTVQ